MAGGRSSGDDSIRDEQNEKKIGERRGTYE